MTTQVQITLVCDLSEAEDILAFYAALCADSEELEFSSSFGHLPSALYYLADHLLDGCIPADTDWDAEGRDIMRRFLKALGRGTAADNLDDYAPFAQDALPADAEAPTELAL